MWMRKTRKALLSGALSLALVLPAVAQWQVPKYHTPFGRGTGTGFASQQAGVPIEMFRLSSDGADDAGALNRGMAALGAAGGGVLQLACNKTYNLASAPGGAYAFLMSGVSVRGCGDSSVLRVANNQHLAAVSPFGWLVFYPPGAAATDNIQFRDFKIDLNGANNSLIPRTGNTTNGSPVVTNTNTTLVRVGFLVVGPGIPARARIATIDGPTQFTLDTNATSSGSAVALDIYTYNANVAITFFKGDNLVVDNVTFVNTPGTQFLVFGGLTLPNPGDIPPVINNVSVTNNRFLGMGTAVQPGNLDFTALYMSAANAVIANNMFSNPTTQGTNVNAGIDLNGRYVTVTGNVFNNLRRAIDFDAVEGSLFNATFTGNTITGAYDAIVLFHDPTFTMKGVVISSNTITQLSGAFGPLIDFDTQNTSGGESLIVSNNTLSSLEAAGTATTAGGLKIGPVKSLDVLGNSFRGFSGPAIELGNAQVGVMLSLRDNHITDVGRTSVAASRRGIKLTNAAAVLLGGLNICGGIIENTGTVYATTAVDINLVTGVNKAEICGDTIINNITNTYSIVAPGNFQWGAQSSNIGTAGQPLLSSGVGGTAGSYNTLLVPGGGTGLASGTSGGIPFFNSATTMASSAVLTANRIVLGGGAGTAPGIVAGLGTITQVLHGNAAGPPSFGAVALGAGGDTSGTLLVGSGGTGLTAGTQGGIPYYNATTTMASSGLLNVNQLVLGGGAGAAPSSLATGAVTQVLHGNPGAAPTWGAVNLAAGGDTTGILPKGSGGTGVATGAVTSVVKQTFIFTGTYTPNPLMAFAVIECVGAGGGGGGAVNGSVNSTFAGAGGGSGGYSRVTVDRSQIIPTKAVTIGSAGAGGAAGANNGGDGGATSVGVLCAANGGGGGRHSNTPTQFPTGGIGATAGTGDVAAAGNPGTPGTYIIASNVPNMIVAGGNGGASFFGGAGQGGNGVGGIAQTGGAAGAYGSGGGGGAVNNAVANAAGGNGSNGFVVIQEYLIP